MPNTQAPYLTIAEVMEPAFDALAKEIRASFKYSDERETKHLLLTRYVLDHVFQHALNFYHGGDV